MTAPGERADAVRALRSIGLTSAADEVLDGYCRLVARVLGVPAAVAAFVDEGRQLLPGLVGLGGQAEGLRQTPESHSLCLRVVDSAQPFVIGDTRARPEMRDTPAVVTLGVVAYIGMPLVSADGHVLGALCAIDHEPRAWSDAEISTMADLARAVTSELQLREANGQARQLLGDAARAAARQTVLSDVSDLLVNTLDPVEGLAALAAAVVPVLADWAMVDEIVDGAVNRVEVAHRDLDIPLADRRRRLPSVPVSDSPISRVIRGVEPMMRLTEVDVAMMQADELGAVQAELFSRLGARHVLVLGLQARGRVLGLITLVRTGAWGFSPEEEQTAGDVARRAALAIDNSRLYALQRGAAETLQAGLLSTLPELGEAHIAGRYVPAAEAAEVGGDWYDAFQLPIAESGNLVIGDVMGHDLDAAVQMGQLRNLLRALAVDRVELPARLISRLDRLLAMLGEEIMATLIVARVDRTDAGEMRLTWSNAGHPPPILVLPDGATRVLTDDEADGPMLGVLPTADRGLGTVLIPDGSTLLLYTDGLVERRDTAIDVRIEQLRSTVAACADGSLDVLLDRVLDELVGRTHDDDVAMLAFRPRPREA